MRKFWNNYRLVFYILRHPFDGFYVIKHEGKGSMLVAFVNFMLLWISFSFASQYASITVNPTNPMTGNSLIEGGTLLLALILWSAANWSVTSLTEGEGKFKEIVMSVCYAMTPIILFTIPAALLSNLMTQGEGAFYFLLINIGVIWFVLLAYVGMVTVHNFTAGKALATLFLTIIALLIIVFLIGLLVTLWQQLSGFVLSLYREIMFGF